MSKPPYPEHQCAGCDAGKELVVSPVRSSIVGDAAIHTPEGWVCMKYMPPKAYKAMVELDKARKPSRTNGDSLEEQ